MMKSQVAPLSSSRRPDERHPHAPTLNGRARHVPARIRIVVVDDHPIALAGLDTLLSGERDLAVVARCVDGYEAVRAVAAHRPDVLVVDQDMPVMDGVAILKHLRAAGDQTPLVLLATTNNQKLNEAVALQVQGVVFKHSDPRQLVRCLREVGAGRRWLDSSLNSGSDVVADGQVLDGLTRRQIEVARAAVSGLSNKELAQRLGVSEGTIKNHLHAIYERLRLDGRLALLLYLKEKALA
jgi:two-component system, NarL family, nitrate/nitrite response regulator NarL